VLIENRLPPKHVLGVALAFAAGPVLKSQLYGFNPYDPMVIAIAVVVLALSALIATLIPALRAASISPVEALRSEYSPTFSAIRRGDGTAHRFAVALPVSRPHDCRRV
jgi:hypothetical protein